ncbi:hypothetical protein D3C85_1596530 [compost metagenome]
MECRPQVLTIAFGVRQIERDAGAGLRLSVLDLKFCKLVTAKPSPESDQHQGDVASVLHQSPEVMTLRCQSRFTLKPAHRLFQVD